MAKPFIYPFLRYEDCPAAIDWLCQAFGFEQHMVVPGEGGAIAHAQLTLGSGMIMLGTGTSPKTRGWRPTGFDGVEQGLYVYVSDVDAQHARAKAAGADIVRPVEPTDYGSREFAAVDPEGYYWSFGTYGPGLDEAAPKA
jgi:uncharacterized glyoxalase superfamily protein PhnB